MDYAYAEYFLQLDEYLTFAQLENLHSRILYADLQAVDDTSSSSYPDPTKPEIMASPVPVAIVLPKFSEFVQTFFPFAKEDIAIGFVANSPHLDNYLLFLDYIIKS